jgi:M6 family metalloprotease-like protein
MNLQSHYAKFVSFRQTEVRPGIIRIRPGRRHLNSHTGPGLNGRIIMAKKGLSLKRRFAFVSLLACSVFITIGTYAYVEDHSHQSTGVVGKGPAPLDPQRVLDQDDMTWKDYHPVPGVDWADSMHKPSVRTVNIALVVADFEDQPFVVTLPRKSDLFGNPQIDPVKREDVARFYADFWNKPQEINHGRTVNEYWMEQSHGKYGVKFDAYGPYRMHRKMTEYGGTVNSSGRRGGASGGQPGAAEAQGGAPATARAGGVSLQGDVDALWKKDAGDKTYDLILRIFAGYDETCLWQEFGEMKFHTKEDITPEFGNPDPTQPRWSSTRYVEWTSWKAASYLWSNSAIICGESSGSIRHEISHAAFRIGDNNNNPYVQPYRRAGSGPWDIMDRGSFNGPGGPHQRYLVPVLAGGAMPAGLMLSQQMKFGFLAPANVLRLNREGLAKSGLAVVRVIPREVDPGADKLQGLVVWLDGAEPRDRTPVQDPNTEPLYGGNHYEYYSMEAVQQIGYDSFAPDSGVLLSRNTGSVGDASSFGGGGRRGEAPPDAAAGRSGAPSGRGSGSGSSSGPRYFNWVIDAHPEDIIKLDFKRPNGEVVMRTIADYRQLNDALFHAGLNSGSQFEYRDEPNRLHFYVIDMQQDSQGIRTYTLGVRSLDGAGPQKRGVGLEAPKTQSVKNADAMVSFTLKNAGTLAPTDATLHFQDSTASLNSDIYRLSVTVEGQGWTAQLDNALAAVKFGESRSIPVYVSRGPRSAATATLTLKAVSESDPSKTASATLSIKGTQ